MAYLVKNKNNINEIYGGIIMNTEQNYTLEQTSSISKFLKFFIPSLLGLFLFIIPLPFGEIFNVADV